MNDELNTHISSLPLLSMYGFVSLFFEKTHSIFMWNRNYFNFDHHLAIAITMTSKGTHTIHRIDQIFNFLLLTKTAHNGRIRFKQNTCVKQIFSYVFFGAKCSFWTEMRMWNLTPHSWVFACFSVCLSSSSFSFGFMCISIFQVNSWRHNDI